MRYNSGDADGGKRIVADWYYIGHVGQVGPFTREQLDELIEGGVVASDTYVWREGFGDWLTAQHVPDLAPSFRKSGRGVPPPPPSAAFSMRPADPAPIPPTYNRQPVYSPISSDKSRTVGGILQFVPGIGRIYLGYAAIGVLQLILSFCGVGVIWSWIDGLLILAGGVKLDGYGRQLND